MNAPFCPINRGQPSNNPRGLPTKLPSIPLAYDLPSLIRSVNIMRDILRTLTTSLTVNNTYMPRPIPQLPNKTYLMSSYPDWRQEGSDIKEGFVFHKTKEGPDKDQRAYISRTNMVEFRQPFIDNDKSLMWRYLKALDSEFGDSNDVPAFEEDFFERVVNVNFPNMGTEIKPGGKIDTSDFGASDSATILVSTMIRIPKSAFNAAKAARQDIPVFMFGKHKKKTKKKKHPDPVTVYPGEFGINISFQFGNFMFTTGYQIWCYLSAGPPWIAVGGPEPQILPPATFTGGFYPSWDPNPSTPSAYFTDDKPINVTINTTPSGQRYGAEADPGSYTHRFTGQNLPYHFKAGGWGGGEAMSFAVYAWWTYEFEPIQEQPDDYDVDVPPVEASVMYVSPSTGGVWLDVVGRPDVPEEGDRWGSGEGNSAGITPDKWHHVLISGDLAGSEKWSITVDGNPAGDYDFGQDAGFRMAVSGLEFGLPTIQSNDEITDQEIDEDGVRKYYPYDLAYIDFRVWFNGHYVNVTEADTIALFIDENYKPVKAEKANKKFGMPDVFLTKGAKTFIKNKGSSATFNATGFSNGKEGLIIDYKPYPKFVGEKDTTKPSPANRG